MNIKIKKLRNLKFRTPEKFDLEQVKKEADALKKHVGLEQLRRHREEIIARWRY